MGGPVSVCLYTSHSMDVEVEQAGYCENRKKDINLLACLAGGCFQSSSYQQVDTDGWDKGPSSPIRSVRTSTADLRRI